MGLTVIHVKPLFVQGKRNSIPKKEQLSYNPKTLLLIEKETPKSSKHSMPQWPNRTRSAAYDYSVKVHCCQVTNGTCDQQRDAVI